MGRAGRMPSNNAYKALHGVSVDRMTSDTPVPGSPVRPSGLSTEAQTFWDVYVPQLVALGMAGEIDTPSLAQLATYYGLWIRTAKELVDADLSSTDGGRLLYANIRSYDAFRKLAVQYGMTCLSRQAVNITPPEQADEFLQ